MTQPEIGGTDKGRAVMIFGSDGAKWIAALIDALGHFQVDVVASGLPGGAAEEATLAAILAQLDVDLSTRAKESGGNLASILARIVEAPPVPTNPVRALGGFVAVGSGSWVEIMSYSVTGGKTFYLTDIYATEHEITSGIQYLVDLLEGANVMTNIRGSGAHPLAEHLTSPIKFTSGQAVKLNVYQWSGASKQFRGTLIGYEV